MGSRSKVEMRKVMNQAELIDRYKLFQNHKKNRAGTSWTYHNQFDQYGFFVIKKLCDPEHLITPVPEKTGQITYDHKGNLVQTQTVEIQVPGCAARNNFPQYKEQYNKIRLEVEKQIGRKLYNTYYFDRFYYPGQVLDYHMDRGPCEISVSVHIGTNLEGDDMKWPFYIESPDKYKDEKKVEVLKYGGVSGHLLQPGDGIVYKGYECPHWRDEMPGQQGHHYYHQVFFHYVLQDGDMAHECGKG